MPYIKTDRRNVFDKSIDAIAARLRLIEGNAGDLNYIITSIINNHIADNGLSYTEINNMIGVLECAKLELYRRVAVPYENTKMVENGDVSIHSNKISNTPFKDEHKPI